MTPVRQTQAVWAYRHLARAIGLCEQAREDVERALALGDATVLELSYSALLLAQGAVRASMRCMRGRDATLAGPKRAK